MFLIQKILTTRNVLNNFRYYLTQLEIINSIKDITYKIEVIRA